MPKTINIQCSCGAVTGTLHDLTPAVTSRVRCCCNGCQTYARRMGREDMLDEHGGSDVVQMSPARIRFWTGEEHIEALHQTRKGAVRWYASCCDTPLANTLATPKSAFVGVFRVNLTSDGGDAAVDDALGPIRVTVNGTFHRADKKRLKARIRDLLVMLVVFIPKYFRWTLRSDYKRSPFFDLDRGTWRLEPTRLYESNPKSEPRLAHSKGCR